MYVLNMVKSKMAVLKRAWNKDKMKVQSSSNLSLKQEKPYKMVTKKCKNFQLCYLCMAIFEKACVFLL